MYTLNKCYTFVANTIVFYKLLIIEKLLFSSLFMDFSTTFDICSGLEYHFFLKKGVYLPTFMNGGELKFLGEIKKKKLIILQYLILL